MDYLWEGPARAADVLRGGVPVAHIGKTALRERADAAIEDSLWHFTTRSRAGHANRVDKPGEEFAAHRPSFMSARWVVDCTTSTYEIAPAGFLSRTYRVSIGGRQIGQSRSASFWSNRPVLTIRDDAPTTEAVFLLWICFLMRQRAGAAAAAGG